jgi:uncharacterized protein
MDEGNLLHTKTQLVVLQPTPFCNINCRYCYLPNRTSTARMTSETVGRILEEVFSSSLVADPLTIAWHAGEPMVLPLSFYHDAYQRMEQLNTQKRHVITTFQTNGTRITQEWCDFFNLHQVTIGISLDGPQFLHDRSRIDRAGRGTFAQTMRGIELLQRNGIQPSILMVLTSEALEYPDEIWEFFAGHHLTQIGFNIEEINGAHTDSSLLSKTDKSRYKRFLTRMFELQASAQSPLSLREVETIMTRIFLLKRPVQSIENRPMAMLSFDYQGNVSSFASELLTMTHPHYRKLHLGNIHERTLEEMRFSEKLLQMNAEIQEGVTQCQQTCNYFAFCGGGSPANKLSEHGTFACTETMHCQLKIQAATDAALEYLESF